MRGESCEDMEKAMREQYTWERVDGDGFADYASWEKWVASAMPDTCSNDWSNTDFAVKANLYAVMCSLVDDLSHPDNGGQ